MLNMKVLFEANKIFRKHPAENKNSCTLHVDCASKYISSAGSSHQLLRLGEDMSWAMWCYCLIVLPCSVVATNASCQTWHYYNSATGHCECGFLLYCSNDGNQAKIRNGVCATSAGQEGDYYIGYCPLTHTINKTSRMYSEMPGNASQLDEVMCGPYNRRGLLCGESKDG